jgi:hypothetical protein
MGRVGRHTRHSYQHTNHLPHAVITLPRLHLHTQQTHQHHRSFLHTEHLPHAALTLPRLHLLGHTANTSPPPLLPAFHDHTKHLPHAALTLPRLHLQTQQTHHRHRSCLPSTTTKPGHPAPHDQRKAQPVYGACPAGACVRESSGVRGVCGLSSSLVPGALQTGAAILAPEWLGFVYIVRVGIAGLNSTCSGILSCAAKWSVSRTVKAGMCTLS